MPAWSFNTWLIAINVAVFLLDHLLGRDGLPGFGPVGQNEFGQVFYQRELPLTYWGHFSAAEALGHLQLWRLITFQFLHASGEHILFNMVALYFFGPLIESFLGSARYLAFYLLCGMGGAVMYLALWGTHFLVASPWEELVGASAGIFGVLIAAAIVAPQATVLIYGIIPLKMRTMAWLMLAWAVGTIILNGHNAGGEAAHLGGAIVGYVLMRNPRWLNVFARTRPTYRPRGL